MEEHARNPRLAQRVTTYSTYRPYSHTGILHAFDQFPGDVEGMLYIGGTGVLDVIGSNSTVYGASKGILRAQGYVNLIGQPVPLLWGQLYRVAFLMRSMAGSPITYAGVAGYRSNPDGTRTLVNANGLDSISSQHYFAVQGTAITTNWTYYEGYFQAQATTGNGGVHNDIHDPGTVHQSANEVAPLLYLNYQDDSLTSYVSWMKIDQVDNQGQTLLAANLVGDINRNRMRMAAGKVTVTPSGASEPYQASANVTSPVGRFTSNNISVVATPRSSTTTLQHCGVAAESTSGFTLYYTRYSTASVTINWVAMQL